MSCPGRFPWALFVCGPPGTVVRRPDLLSLGKGLAAEASEQVAGFARQAAPAGSIAPVAHRASIKVVEPALHRLAHPALADPAQRLPAAQATPPPPLLDRSCHLHHLAQGPPDTARKSPFLAKRVAV